MTLKIGLLSFAASVALAFPLQASDLLGDLPIREMNGLEGPSKPRAVSNKPVANAPLIEEGLDQIAGYNLRTRSWVIGGENAGVVPIHSHADRPAIVYVLEGEIYEYRNDADERIKHSAGGLSLEEGAVTHWWINEGPQDVRLIAFDVFNSNSDVTTGETPTQQSFDLPAAQDAQLDLLGLVDIEQHYGGEKGQGLALSAYRAVIEPGGVLPSFVAAGEPLQVWVYQGEVMEHRSDTDAPVVLATDSGAHLGGGAQAYWENAGSTSAELFFAVVEPIGETEGVPQVGRQAHHAN